MTSDVNWRRWAERTRSAQPAKGFLEVHATRVGPGACGASFGLVGDDDRGGEEQGRDRGRVLQRRAGDLGRVDDPGLDQVLVLTGGRVQALARAETTHLLRDHAALEARVDRDLLERSLQRHPHDVGARRLVTVKAEALEQTRTRLDERHAATGDDALLHGRLRVAHGVLDAVL